MAFFNDITLGQYFHAHSFVHRLDPRTKMIAVFMGMSVLLISTKWLLLCASVIFVVIALLASGLPLLLVLRNLRPFILLFVITFFIQLLFTNGTVIWSFEPLYITISREGLMLGIIFSVRLALLIVLAAVLTLTTTPIDMTDALERLFKPLNRLHVPVHDLVMIMSLALRFIPTLMEEAERIKNAQLSRGASFEGTLVQRARNILPLVLPLFISAFRRADELALAMDARGYQGGVERTGYGQLVFKSEDYIVFGFIFLFTVFSVWVI